MELLPANALGWLRAGLLVAKFYVAAVACLISPSRFFPNDAQVAVLLSFAAATLLLLVGGLIQLFTADRPKALLNLVMGVFATFVLSVLIATFAADRVY